MGAECKGLFCQVRIAVAWWVRWYIAGVSLCARMTGAQPDMDKVGNTVLKGIRVE